jgi:hypothetical protein
MLLNVYQDSPIINHFERADIKEIVPSCRQSFNEPSKYHQPSLSIFLPVDSVRIISLSMCLNQQVNPLSQTQHVYPIRNRNIIPFAPTRVQQIHKHERLGLNRNIKQPR